jgi:hypothetical protein
MINWLTLINSLISNSLSVSLNPAPLPLSLLSNSLLSETRELISPFRLTSNEHEILNIFVPLKIIEDEYDFDGVKRLEIEKLSESIIACDRLKIMLLEAVGVGLLDSVGLRLLEPVGVGLRLLEAVGVGLRLLDRVGGGWHL